MKVFILTNINYEEMSLFFGLSPPGNPQGDKKLHTAGLTIKWRIKTLQTFRKYRTVVWGKKSVEERNWS